MNTKQAATKSCDRIKTALTVPENKASFGTLQGCQGPAQRSSAHSQVLCGSQTAQQKRPGFAGAPGLLISLYEYQVVVTPSNSLLRKQTLGRCGNESLPAYDRSSEEPGETLVFGSAHGTSHRAPSPPPDTGLSEAQTVHGGTPMI